MTSRLEKRELFVSEDQSVSLIIKSGDLTNLKWLIESGYPLNHMVTDTNGNAFHMVEIAEEYGQDAIAQYLRSVEAAGTPRQEITITLQGRPPAKFIMANSGGDWKNFKKEVGAHFGIPANKVKITRKGDTAKLKWNQLRANRPFMVMSK